MKTRLELTTTNGVVYALHKDTTVDELWDLLIAGSGGGPEPNDPLHLTKADGTRLITQWGFVYCVEEVPDTSSDE